MLAYGRLHDVDDNVTTIDQHPFAGLLAFDAVNPAAGFFYFVENILGERLGLPGRIRAGDCDVIEDGSKF